MAKIERKRAQSFGALVRRERMGKKIGLREMARKIDVSAAYLSMIERNPNLPPPAEKTVRKIAKFIGRDEDELLELAGRAAADVIILAKNRKNAGLLRVVREIRDSSATSGQLLSNPSEVNEKRDVTKLDSIRHALKDAMGEGAWAELAAWLLRSLAPEAAEREQAVKAEAAGEELRSLAREGVEQKQASKAINPEIAEWITREGVEDELSEAVAKYPQELATLLRTTRGFQADVWKTLLAIIRGLQTNS
jgi:HTH-type transcriptional regulator, competence development regulator